MAKFSFFPKNKIFYTLFDELSQDLVLHAEAFHAFLTAYTQGQSTASQTAELMQSSLPFTELLRLDKKAESTSAQLHTTLLSTFVTPMDREDIHNLNKTLLSIVEHVTSATRRFDMYHVHTVEADIFPLAEVLIECVKEIALIMAQIDNLTTLEKFTPHIDHLQSLEKKGDQIYRSAVKKLFQTPQDPLHVIKWKDIYERLENAIDKCNSTGSILMGIILKYA